MKEEIKKIITLILNNIEEGKFGTANEHTKTLKLLLDNESPPHQPTGTMLKECVMNLIEAAEMLREYLVNNDYGDIPDRIWLPFCNALKTEQAAFTNNARDEIYANIINSTSPCAYCTESGNGNCDKCCIQTHQYFFKGRKLSPVA